MRILSLKDRKKLRAVEIKALLGDTEFEQLKGNLHDLLLVSTKLLKERATATKTGATHAYTKYLLLPVSLRRQFPRKDWDFDSIRCATAHYRDKLYIIYQIPQTLGAVTEEER